MKNFIQFTIIKGRSMWMQKILVACLIMVVSAGAIAQGKVTVKGNVTSAEGTLPGVAILEKGTQNGVVTDLDGNYSINVASDGILVFSFVGYVQVEQVVGSQTTIDLVMVEDIEQLEEIVVIGYGTQKKSHLTGAISKVTNEQLDQIPAARADDALVGRVSGVNIQATGGDGNDQGVGADPQIRIRGTGSITGNAGPLLVIDGVAVDSDFWANIDMNDVESFEILKDAASASVFGSRGANGVIMITTKQGKAGKTKFSYNAFAGVQNVKRNDDYNKTAAESFALERAANGGDLSDRSRLKELIIQANGGETDWQDVIFDGGMTQSHSLSARGGKDKTKFSTSLTYLHDEGVMVTDDFKRYNLKAKVDTEVNNKLSFGISVNPSYSERRRFDGSTHDILRQTPWQPVYITEANEPFVNRVRDGGKYADTQIGDYALQRMFDDYDLAAGVPVTSGQDISNTSNTSPLAKVQERDRRDYKFKTFGRIYGKYKILEDLTALIAFSGSIQDTRRTRWQGVEAHRNGASNAQSNRSDEFMSHLVTETFLTYDKTIDNHSIVATIGMSTERRNQSISSAAVSGYGFDYITTLNGGSNLLSATSFTRQARLESYVARVNYAFSDKYLASVSIRRDGSSVFGPNNKFGNFPALSLGWRLSEEDFLNGSDVVNNLKLRVSYGVTGNDQFRTSGGQLVDWYAYAAIYTSASAVVNNSNVSAFNALNIANPNLKWEQSVEFNPAIDFGFFGNIVTGSIDYYKRTSDQLLIDQPISTSTGFSNALQNIGEVVNEGIEVEVRTNQMRTDDFSWSTTLIGSRNKNTLTDFSDANGQIVNVDSKRAAEWINLEGNPISSFYGYVVDTELPLEYLKEPFHPIGAAAQDVFVRDLNGDGLIDADDKTVLGSPYPDFVWSVTNDFTYKNFDLSFMFQGSLGAEVRNMADQYLYNHFNSGQDYVLSQMTDEDQARVANGFVQQKIFTSSIVQDASYVALRNVNLGFNLPKSVLGSTGIQRARIYFSGQNLLYLKSSGYTGFNPEAIARTSAITHGYQLGGGAIPRKFVLGVNIDF
ncbi:MAG: TonB-dependent receptor [Cyclobacteriaceae bacterium]